MKKVKTRKVKAEDGTIEIETLIEDKNQFYIVSRGEKTPVSCEDAREWILDAALEEVGME